MHFILCIVFNILNLFYSILRRNCLDIDTTTLYNYKFINTKHMLQNSKL